MLRAKVGSLVFGLQFHRLRDASPTESSQTNRALAPDEVRPKRHQRWPQGRLSKMRHFSHWADLKPKSTSDRLKAERQKAVPHCSVFFVCSDCQVDGGDCDRGRAAMSKILRDGRVGSLKEGSLAVCTWLAGRTRHWATSERLLERKDPGRNRSRHRHSVRISWPCGRGAANSLAGGYDGSGESVKRVLGEKKRRGKGGRSYTCMHAKCVAFHLRKGRLSENSLPKTRIVYAAVLQIYPR